MRKMEEKVSMARENQNASKPSCVDPHVAPTSESYVYAMGCKCLKRDKTINNRTPCALLPPNCPVYLTAAEVVLDLVTDVVNEKVDEVVDLPLNARNVECLSCNDGEESLEVDCLADERVNCRGEAVDRGLEAVDVCYLRCLHRCNGSDFALQVWNVVVANGLLREREREV